MVFLQIFWVLPAPAQTSHPEVAIFHSCYQGYEWSDEELLLNSRQELLPGAPLVFAGINNFTPARRQGQKKVVGMTEVPLSAVAERSLAFNKHASFYRGHKKWLWRVFAVFGFFSLAIVFLITNIMRRRLAEKALLASEISLRSVIDCTGEAILTLDRNRVITSFNPAFTRMLGYTAEEVLGQSVSLIHPSAESFQNFRGMVSPMIAATGWRGEYDLMAKDGTLIPTEISLAPQRLPDGTLMGYIGAYRDIRERQEAEEAIKESEERFRLLVENAPDAIFIQTEKRFAYLNKEALRLFGAATEDQLLGRSILDRIHPDFRDIVQERIRLVNEEGKAVPRMEQQYLKMDDTPINVEVSVVPFKFKGQKDGLFFIRDITERKEAEKAQKRLEAQLFQAQKMEALGTLAGGIAHDFNNILGAMLGFAELAYLGVPERSEEREYLEDLLKAGNRARSLVKQILSFSRQKEATRQPLFLTPIIKETLKFLRSSLPTTIEIHTHLHAGKAMVEADPTQIHQILLNLATNAVHAMEDKGGLLEIGLKVVTLSPEDPSTYKGMPRGSYLELSVRDTGHGMEPEVLERIFEPFFTTKEPGKGTGMGLAVVYGIITSFDGTIQVNSHPGGGTTFQVLLPLAHEELEESGPEAMVPQPGFKGSGCILFVDDDEDFFLAGQQMLTKLGYEVMGYDNSLKALEEFKANPQRFDLIISDQTMPGLTGLELAAACSRLRPDIPFILCTGLSEIITAEKAPILGISDVVTKPYDLHRIGEIIKNLLRAKEK